MDLNGRWVPLKEDNYVVTGKNNKALVRSKENDKEIIVLRDSSGEILFVKENENGILSPTSSQKGHPVEIKPVTYEKDGKTFEVEDAGKGTAWMIRRLLDLGYFKA